MRLDHAAIRVTDVARARHWYERIVGLMAVGEADLSCGGRTVLTLVPGGVGLDHFAFEVDELSGPDVAHDPEPGASAAKDVCLPSGHRLQLIVADPKPGYVLVSDRPPAAAAAPIGIDHVNLAVRELDSLATYAREQLGFRVSDVHRVEGRLVGAWLRQGERHHDLAALRHRQDALHHVAFTMPSATSMLAFADRVVACGGHVEYGIGRHGPGSNLFLYVRDPDGNRVELTAEMALVPESAPTREWEGTDPHIIDVWTAYQPPREFWEVT